MPERPRLDAVLLDAGGTLVRLDFEWMAEQLAELGVPVTWAGLRRAEIAGRRRYDALRTMARGAGGTSSPPEARAYFIAMIEAAGAAPEVVDAALERFLARHAERGLWTRPVEGARAAIDALGALGLRRAVISNADGRAEEHLRDCDVLDGIEFVVDSHKVGVEKPDVAIFRIALERLGANAARALFVGDIRSVDEEGARASGMPFVLLDPYGDYAPDGVPAIREIAGLPAWIERGFEVPAPRVAAGKATALELEAGGALGFDPSGDGTRDGEQRRATAGDLGALRPAPAPTRLDREAR